MAAREPKIRYKENPYTERAVAQTVEGYRLIKGKDSSLLVIENGTHGGMAQLTGFYQKVTVDKTHFIKLYADGVQALLGLKSAGKKVFNIVYRRLFDDDMYGKDRIILNYDMLTDDEKAQISESTLYRGLRDLIASEVLAFSSVDGVYWLNPSYIYRGDRLAYCKEYVLRKEKDVTPGEEKAKTRTRRLCGTEYELQKDENAEA